MACLVTIPPRRGKTFRRGRRRPTADEDTDLKVVSTRCVDGYCPLGAFETFGAERVSLVAFPGTQGRFVAVGGEASAGKTGGRRPAAGEVRPLLFLDHRLGFPLSTPATIGGQFTRDGHRVFYVSQWFVPGRSVALRKREENIFELSLPGDPGCNLYRDALSAESVQEMAAAVDRFRLESDCVTAVLFLELAFWTLLAEELRRRLDWPIVYDCMDDHVGFSTHGDAVLEAERRLLAVADLTVVSSAPLQEKAGKTSRNVALVRNGGDYRHFAQASGVVARYGTVIGYYGAIADWFDGDLVADLAELHPDWEFHLVEKPSPPTFAGCGRSAT